MPTNDSDLHIRTEKDVVSEFNKGKSENKMSSGDYFKKLVIKASSTLSVCSQLCPFFSENDNSRDREDVNLCFKDDLKEGERLKVPKLVKRVFCDHHYLHTIIDTAVQKKEQIEQENVKSRELHRQEEEEHKQKLVKIKGKIDEAQAELKNIENLTLLPDEIEKKNKEIAELETELERVNNSIEGYYEPENNKLLKDKDREIAGLKAEIENLEKEIENDRVAFANAPKNAFEIIQENPQKKPPDSIVESRSQAIQRTFEEKKTTIEEKKVTQVVSSPLENLEWACYFNPNEYVSTKKCMPCPKGRACPYSQFLTDDQIPPNAKTRPRAFEP